MFVKTVRSMSPGAWFALGLISLVIGFAGVYGWSYSQSQSGGSPTIEPLWEVIISVLVALGVALLLLLMNAGLTKLAYVSLNRGDEPTKLDRVLPKMMPKSVALFALILILFWSPYLVAVFPGVLYNDTTVQMQQVYEGAHPLNIRFGGNYQLGEEELEAAEKMNEYQKRSSVLSLTDAWLIDHHPFALTLFLGGIASLSDALFGNWMPALGFLMILQTILYASALSFAIAYVRKRGAPPSLCLAVLLFFCLFPAIPYFVGMIMKDCFFTFFCIPYLLMLAESVFTKGTFHHRGVVPLPDQEDRCLHRGRNGIVRAHRWTCGSRSGEKGFRWIARHRLGRGLPGDYLGFPPPRGHQCAADVRHRALLHLPGAQYHSGKQSGGARIHVPANDALLRGSWGGLADPPRAGCYR